MDAGYAHDEHDEEYDVVQHSRPIDRGDDHRVHDGIRMFTR